MKLYFFGLLIVLSAFQGCSSVSTSKEATDLDGEPAHHYPYWAGRERN